MPFLFSPHTSLIILGTNSYQPIRMHSENDNRFPYFGGLSPYNVTYVHLFNAPLVRECELGIAPILSNRTDRRHVRNNAGICYLVLKHITEFYLTRPLENNGLTYLSTLRIREVVFTCTEHPPLHGPPNCSHISPVSSEEDESDGEVFYSD